MTDAQLYTFLTLFIILLVAIIITIIFQFNTSRYIIGKKFKLKNYFETTNDSTEIMVKYTIHNPNLIDARILGFGYLFKNHTIDYMKNYQISANCPDKVVIQSRDYITLQIDKDELINNIIYFNKGYKRISKLKLYVIDHQGETTRVNAKIMKKAINDFFKEKREDEKKKLIEVKKQEKLNLLQIKKDQKEINKNRKLAQKNLKELNKKP